MKKKWNKGFTLVELLAMLTVLGILMLVTVPNISKILENNRVDKYRMDAKKMIAIAKIKMAKAGYEEKIGSEENPESRIKKVVVFALNYLDSNDDITVGPYGGEYDQFNSLVVCIINKDGTTNYYVRLIEKYKEKYYGFSKHKSLEEIKQLEKIEKVDTNGFNNITKESYYECKNKCNDCDPLTGKEKSDCVAANCNCVSHLVRYWIHHNEKLGYSWEEDVHGITPYLETGDISCPTGSYMGTARLKCDSEGKNCVPCSDDSDTGCKYLRTCVCYESNTLYDPDTKQCKSVTP